MRARKYTKKIEFFQTTKVADGFGGNTMSSVSLGSFWCKIDSLSANSRFNGSNTNFGTLDLVNSYKITLRKGLLDFNQKDMYILYRNDKYIIQTQPNNINFTDSEIEIFITKEV